jgi:hypothetical protein
MSAHKTSKNPQGSDTLRGLGGVYEIQRFYLRLIHSKPEFFLGIERQGNPDTEKFFQTFGLYPVNLQSPAPRRRGVCLELLTPE